MIPKTICIQHLDNLNSDRKAISSTECASVQSLVDASDPQARETMISHTLAWQSERSIPHLTYRNLKKNCQTKH